MTDEQSPTPPEPRAVRMLTKSRNRNAARANRRKRTANNPEGPRTKKVEIKLSAAEHAEVLELAAIADVRPPRLFREALFAAEIPVSPDEFRELVHELFRVQSALRALGNNLNQIAKAVNSTGELGELAGEFGHLLAGIRAYSDRAGAAIETVTRW
ncbi:plasmid mobilization protein [Nocardia sp. IFM 10818]